MVIEKIFFSCLGLFIAEQEMFFKFSLLQKMLKICKPGDFISNCQDENVDFCVFISVV